MGFLLLAPRLHALGKSRGYVTISEFIHDRYLPPAGAPWVGARMFDCARKFLVLLLLPHCAAAQPFCCQIVSTLARSRL